MIEHNIDLPSNDNADITLKLPNGEIMQLQWRVENGSLDICLPEELRVTNWKGDDMEPADIDADFTDGHVRYTKQLVVDFKREHVEEPA